MAENEEILMLPRTKLVEFIQSDQLFVETEDMVFQAVIDWVSLDEYQYFYYTVTRWYRRYQKRLMHLSQIRCSDVRNSNLLFN